MKKFLVLGLVWMLALSCASLPSGYERVEKGSNIIYKYDKFKDITWYKHSSYFNNYDDFLFVSSYFNNYDDFYFYFGEGKDGFNPRLVFYYYGYDWIWFNKAIFYCNKKLNINLKEIERKTEINNGFVSERYDMHLSDFSKGTLDEIYKLYKYCSKVELRLTGESSRTRAIKEPKRLAFIETYEFYQKKLKESKEL